MMIIILGRKKLCYIIKRFFVKSLQLYHINKQKNYVICQNKNILFSWKP